MEDIHKTNLEKSETSVYHVDIQLNGNTIGSVEVVAESTKAAASMAMHILKFKAHKSYG